MPAIPPPLSIRRLNADDAVAFSALRQEVTADDPVPMGLTLEEERSRPLQIFKDLLSYPQPNLALGAFVGAALVGSAAIAWPNKFPSSRHRATLWGVFMSPRYRGQGFGRQLLLRIVEHAKSNALRRINLTMYVPNTVAANLYASLGFEPVGLEPEAVHLNGRFYDAQLLSLRVDG